MKLKCSFFRKEITYLAHQISKDGVQLSNSNLEAITECTPPQTYTEVHAFPSLVGHYRRFIKRFAHIAQPLSKYLSGEGASKKSEWVSLTENALKAFETLNEACMTAPILTFADFCCHRNRQTGITTPSLMAAEPFYLMRRTTTQLTSSF